MISDGGENGSRYTETKIRNAMAETGARVYVAGVEEPVAGTGRPREEGDGAAFLFQIAEGSGGFMPVSSAVPTWQKRRWN